MTSAAEGSLKRYRYTGKERDEETGFSYHGARYYVSGLGTWISPDKAQIAPESPRYHYSGQNPMVYTDPTGFYQEPIHGALTYKLALAAGFSQKDAAQIALVTAGVDHDPLTEPTNPRNIRSGVTAKYHFASFEQAESDIRKDIDKGSAVNLVEFGKHLHTLEDVGFKDAPGPHRRALGPPVSFLGIYSLYSFGPPGYFCLCACYRIEQDRNWASDIRNGKGWGELVLGSHRRRSISGPSREQERTGNDIRLLEASRRGALRVSP